MIRRVILLVALLVPIASFAQLKVSDNGRFLLNDKGEPFFWLGDTDWELFHRLNREETIDFLDQRSQQGFNVIQAVALAEFNGVRQPNRYGDWPLNNEDPTQLATTPGNRHSDAYEYDYWDHVDFVIDEIIKRKMYIGLLPTWGDKVAQMWGEGPVIFNEKNAEGYGRLLATRYKDRAQHVIWILGGDRPVRYQWKTNGVEQSYDDILIWRAMARGIESVLGKEAFITYHPNGGRSSSEFVHEEPWLDMNAYQSGHGSREAEAWTMTIKDLSRKPVKPVLDMEPCYEDHPVNPWDGKWTREGRGYFSDYDVRARTYRSVFAGSCGVTYGHHQIWQFLNKSLYEPINIGDTLIGWRKAMTAAAAGQMKHLKNLMLSRPFINRIADQTIVLSNTGTDYRDLIIATRDTDASYAMIYLPQNKPVTVDISRLSGKVKNVFWFSPQTGTSTEARTIKSGQHTLTPPSSGRDWVLVIDDAARKFPVPGSTNEMK